VIINQKFTEEDGKVRIRNTIDVSQAIGMARDVSESRARGKNMVPLGYIPPEYWNFDPWLLEAKRARSAGDSHEYQKYVMKFFRVHPEFAVIQSAKYWSGAR
jgi:hypothetical protein